MVEEVNIMELLAVEWSKGNVNIINIAPTVNPITISSSNLVPDNGNNSNNDVVAPKGGGCCVVQ